MGLTVQEGPLVAKGYPYTLQIDTENPMFSASHSYKAQVRVKPTDASVLAEITTSNGITYISPTSLMMTIPAAATASFPVGEVWMDVVRIDVSPPIFMGFQWSIPVITPVTRSP